MVEKTKFGGVLQMNYIKTCKISAQSRYIRISPTEALCMFVCFFAELQKLESSRSDDGMGPIRPCDAGPASRQRIVCF